MSQDSTGAAGVEEDTVAAAPIGVARAQDGRSGARWAPGPAIFAMIALSLLLWLAIALVVKFVHF